VDTSRQCIDGKCVERFGLCLSCSPCYIGRTCVVLRVVIAFESFCHHQSDLVDLDFGQATPRDAANIEHGHCSCRTHNPVVEGNYWEDGVASSD
jgi:hypothetical protein